jgi:basic membrane protein A
VRRFFWNISLVVLVTLSLLGTAWAQVEQITAGFIYVGPTDDNGWTEAHDTARQIVDDEFDWLETIAVESVPEADAEVFIDQLVQQGANVIFTTSFGFMDATLAAAARYPDVVFAHATGFQRAPNVATYTAEFYQIYYLNGLMAGALSESGNLGYVAAFPIPEVKRHIDAFTLGAREVNPEATVNVRWLNSWYNPAAATEATQALIAEGADVFAFTEDSPTVIQVAAERGLPSFGHYSPMLEFSPEHVISGQLVHWDEIYRDILSKIHDGTYTPQNMQDVDYWSLLYSGAVEIGAEEGLVINPAFEEPLKAVMVNDSELGEISVFDLVTARLEQMDNETPEFDPFTGPIMDRNGNEVVAAGETMDVGALASMQWAVEGVEGSWPDEP